MAELQNRIGVYLLQFGKPFGACDRSGNCTRNAFLTLFYHVLTGALGLLSACLKRKKPANLPQYVSL
jgi:hypothetical protein